MLKNLSISNAAVIKYIELEPCPGFNAVTGVTGAGKSILADCIGFMLGKKTSADLIRSGEERLSVSLLFSDIGPEAAEFLSSLGIETEDGEMLAEKVLSRDGRTSCRVNGKTVTKQILSSACGILASLHAQNDSITVLDMRTRIGILDSAAGSSPLLKAYRKCYEECADLSRKLSEVRKNESDSADLKEILSHRIAEIDSAKLRPGEFETLTRERDLLKNTEKITKAVDAALRAIYSNEKGITASYLAGKAASSLDRIVPLVPELVPLCERLRECVYELDDISSTLKESVSGVYREDAEERLDEIEDRLYLISSLKRKYSADDIDGLLLIRNESAEKLEKLEKSGFEADELKKRLEMAVSSRDSAAVELTEARRKIAAEIEKSVLDTLEYLDMPKAVFRIDVSGSETPRPDGYDCVDFLLSANPGEPMMQIEKCASGGELSRVMLAISCALSSPGSGKTLVFDEIDTGISGSTSRKIGYKLLDASASSQIICITHSAQIASLAECHFRISKSEVASRTESSVSVLSGDERTDEIARILGGINVSASQREAAYDMLDKKDRGNT